MCTATIIPAEGGGFRVVMNRDELRSRPRALRPAAIDLDSGVRAAWPTDALAGGTWVAASDRGLVLGLLNGNPRPYPALPDEATLVSRGMLIPGLISAPGPRQAMADLRAMDLSRIAPFRLVAVGQGLIADAVWDARRLRIARREMRPMCYVSSGLGDVLVAPRLRLFKRWIARFGVSSQAQDAFHEHRWPRRPEVSVMMERDEARTVSVTSIEVREDGSARMRYRDDSGSCAISLTASERDNDRRGEARVERASREVGGRAAC